MRWVQGDCWQQPPLAASKLLLCSFKREPFLLMFVPSSNCIFTSLIIIHLLVHPHPLRTMAPGSQTVLTPNPTLHHTNESIIQLLPYFNPHSHTLDFVITELFELLEFKLHHQPPLCSVVPSLQLFLSSNFMDTQVLCTFLCPMPINSHVYLFSLQPYTQLHTRLP